MARPRVGLLYTHASALSREGEYLAKYIGLALASTGAATKVAVVAVDVDGSKDAQRQADEKETAIIRADGVVFKRSQVSPQVSYEESRDVRALGDCHVWIVCLDAATSENALQFVEKRVPKGEKDDKTVPKRRVIVSLQPALRQIRELERSFPKDAVLVGGACFHLTKNKNDILYPLSHGCYFIERLSSEKSDALYALDLLEATGFQLLSRKNIQALKWGHTMLRLFYYVNALTGETVAASLQDRAMRLVYLEMLYEMDSLFTAVTADLNEVAADKKEAAARRSWAPDASACTYFSIHAIMVLLPLPNWMFSLVGKFIDLGLTASGSGFSTIARDVEARRETQFWSEFKDVFDLASRRSIELPALTALKNTLSTLAEQKKQDGEAPPRISGRGLLSEIKSSPKSREVLRRFFVKIIVTIVATLLLVLYFSV